MLAKLKELKAKSGMSYQQIAEKSNIPESTIARIFAGKTLNPSISTFISIVKAMGGTAADVFDDEIRVDLDPATPEQIKIVENVVEVVEEVEDVIEKPRVKREVKEFFGHCPYHDEITHFYRTAVKKKDKWIIALTIGCAVLVLLIVCTFLIDLLNHNIGYIR